MTFAPTCFGSCRNHHQGAVLCLAKTKKYVFFSVLVVIDAVNVTAACKPVVQACSSQWRQELQCSSQWRQELQCSSQWRQELQCSSQWRQEKYSKNIPV